MDNLLPPDIVALAQRVIEENKRKGLKVALAESCTGGLVGAALTEIPGSSAVFDRAFVTYSNEAKQDVLGVQSEIIESLGAVSAATVWAMAQGAIAHSDADTAVAISGIAGPGGGDALKPVGTVAFARAERGSEDVKAEERLIEAGTRADIRHQAALIALELLLP